MKNFSHIAARVLNTPLLLEPSYARTFFSALSGRLGISELKDSSGSIETAQRLRLNLGRPVPVAMDDDDCWWGASEPVAPYEHDRGVALLPVSGTLVHKHGYLRPYSGMTGYDGIVRRLNLALADPQIKGVLLDMDTAGGEVAGCFDAVAKLRQMAAAAGKPLWALCYDMNCSAGMAIASSADRRLVTQTGVAGSVGVLMAHASFEKYLQEEGIKVTLIHSGARKVEGNPYQDLPDDVLKRFTGETNALRQAFAELVATMIGIDVSAVLQTEAGTYRGQEAIDIGFADELVNGNDAIDIFADHLSSQGRTTTIGGNTMSNTTQQSAAAAQTVASTQAEAGGTSVQGTVGQMDAGALAQAGISERQRIEQILASDEAKGRTTLANHLAFKTAMSVDEAKGALAAAPAESGATSTPLDVAMAATAQPNISADGSQEQSDSQKEVSAIVRDYAMATGNTRK